MQDFSIRTYLFVQKTKKILKGKKGDFVQQGLLWTLIAIAGIAALTTMGGAIKDKFIDLSNTFTNVTVDGNSGGTDGG
ncbi:Flp family type IVb pilin [Chengkuizengella sp. SCS-71B]|uniref:Flp family type IVb pilin n=1 Tax=Chengkuizengella sp. SCS-71B TaxID=3115290 RepID=UPI0032C2429E